MVIATWEMSRIGGYRQVGSGEKGALKSMVTSRPQRVRQEYGRFIQCCGRQKVRNASNGVGGDFPLETKCGLLSRFTPLRRYVFPPLRFAHDFNIFRKHVTDGGGRLRYSCPDARMKRCLACLRARARHIRNHSWRPLAPVTRCRRRKESI